MNDKELEQEIIKLNDKSQGNIKIDKLKEESFIEQDDYKYLQTAFRESKYFKYGWDWHQLVRLVLEKPEVKKNMYDRLLNLILKHRKSYNEYFKLSTEEGTYWIPNYLADLNRLEILYDEYLDIYRNIIKTIQFNYPKLSYSGNFVKGKINWNQTIRSSFTEYPLYFSSNLRKVNFITPENILLILCAEWMYRESGRLLRIEFMEPLTDLTKSILNSINNKAKSILEWFPFIEVLDYSKSYWKFSLDDARIKSLEQETRHKINSKIISNHNYGRLLNWIEKFRELNISSISADVPTRHILDSVKNLDTVYEAWIFLEFVDFLYEKNILITFSIEEKYCKFSHGSKIITFWYEKGFVPKEKGGDGFHAWISTHTPDFTAMLDNEIIATFDAKNYTKSSVADPINKMLAYMANLDSRIGILFFPYYPENWDELKHDKRIEKLKNYSKKLPSNDKFSETIKRISKLYWAELSEELKIVFPYPNYKEQFENSTRILKPRYHINQILCLLRMSPVKSESAILMKRKSLEYVLDSLIAEVKKFE